MKTSHAYIRRPANVYKDEYKQQCAQLNFGLTQHQLRHINTHLKFIFQTYTQQKLK